jgi:hypothetical protein
MPVCEFGGIAGTCIGKSSHKLAHVNDIPLREFVI